MKIELFYIFSISANVLAPTNVILSFNSKLKYWSLLFPANSALHKLFTPSSVTEAPLRHRCVKLGPPALPPRSSRFSTIWFTLISVNSVRRKRIIRQFYGKFLVINSIWSSVRVWSRKVIVSTVPFM
jgi:hypothetical protein